MNNAQRRAILLSNKELGILINLVTAEKYFTQSRLIDDESEGKYYDELDKLFQYLSSYLPNQER